MLRVEGRVRFAFAPFAVQTVRTLRGPNGPCSLPRQILLGLAKILWRVGVGEAHAGQLHGGRHGELGVAAVLAQDQLEHTRRVRHVAVVPIGGDVRPVAEVGEALAGEEVHELARNLLKLYITIECIFLAVADQQASHILHRLGHAAAASLAAHAVAAHLGEAHHLGQTLERKDHRRVVALHGGHEPLGGLGERDQRAHEAGAAGDGGLDLGGAPLHVAVLEDVEPELGHEFAHLGLGLGE